MAAKELRDPRDQQLFPARDAIRDALLALVHERGGEILSSDTYEPLADHFALSAKARTILRSEYYAEDDRREAAWHNLIQWARRRLVEERLLDSMRQRGVWRLTKAGKAEAQRLGLRLASSPGREAGEEDEEMLSFTEGEERGRFVLHRKRERGLRAYKIQQALTTNSGRLRCEVPGCGFDFVEVYGEKGYGFAHVHHLRPLASLRESQQVTAAELAIVCANCHAMIHRNGECRPLEDLVTARTR
ncbi:winged helix-turn-helix domain-containing protein [Sorangium sp. So ce388]|uniref:winged helix-turn-helix domain-containing protein n=1 Tax=Sorangium sp. So ce388 TaxID=3133309 RepID=UPI003F5BE9BB